jgi:hypothetical protein
MAEFVISGPSLDDTPVTDGFARDHYHSLRSNVIPNPVIVRYNKALRAHFLRIREQEELHFAETLELLKTLPSGPRPPLRNQNPSHESGSDPDPDPGPSPGSNASDGADPE